MENPKKNYVPDTEDVLTEKGRTQYKTSNGEP
jgi:hypothetical protein